MYSLDATRNQQLPRGSHQIYCIAPFLICVGSETGAETGRQNNQKVTAVFCKQCSVVRASRERDYLLCYIRWIEACIICKPAESAILKRAFSFAKWQPSMSVASFVNNGICCQDYYAMDSKQLHNQTSVRFEFRNGHRENYWNNLCNRMIYFTGAKASLQYLWCCNSMRFAHRISHQLRVILTHALTVDSIPSFAQNMNNMVSHRQPLALLLLPIDLAELVY